MKDSSRHTDASLTGKTVVIGAGIGGLTAALRLVVEGHDVTLLERHSHVGGKIRQVPSTAGGVDTGPTVLTMRHVFDRLFKAAGSRLEDHVTLFRQQILARHWWAEGTQLDLFADPDRSANAVAEFAGPKAAREFQRFHARTRRLFDAFRDPMMENAEPSLPELTKTVMQSPGLVRDMAPLSTLARLLKVSFSDPRLRQLFGRYATYVGGSPYQSPALLSLIWQAEAAGVWVVQGGMHKLAQALAGQIIAAGGQIRTGVTVAEIVADANGVQAVRLADGTTIAADRIVFNGDPRALATGCLGDQVAHVAPQTRTAARSLSARVWAFAAKPEGVDLAHHNVFFCADPKADFAALQAGRLPDDTTYYICAQDRGQGETPPEVERFEIIENAPPLRRSDQEDVPCLRKTFHQLRKFGITFSPEPTAANLTTPKMFDSLFPASLGSLYGQSPHGTTAALKRPRAVTSVPGLYLAGGGCHPGAGVPMAALSGLHAAEAILMRPTSTSLSRQTVMRGGMSTGSRIAEPAQFRSSRS